MNLKCSILFLLIPWYCAAKYSSFIASFQFFGHWSAKEYLEYKESLPQMSEFSVCHWEKTKFFSDRLNTIWAYCQQSSKNDPTMSCIQNFYYTPGAAGDIVFSLYKSNWGHKKLKIYKKFGRIQYGHGHCNHFCLLYSISSNSIKLYHNGRKMQILTLKENNGPSPYSMPNSSMVYDSAFVVGQEPDSMRGRFVKGEAFTGDISELNIWDRSLDDAEIYGLAKCNSTKRGNIVTWNENKFTMNQVKTTSISDPALFCINNKQYLMIPELLAFNEATRRCAHLGGRITVPHNQMEKENILRIFGGFNDKCLIKNVSEKAIWLGIYNPGYSWYENEINGTSVAINYSNWRHTGSWRHKNMCAYLFTDGTWGYDKQETCQQLLLCTICYFTTISIFNLKGQYQGTPHIERIYYMSINRSHQLDSFDGIFRRTKIYRHPNQKWYIKQVTSKTNQLLLRDKAVPAGRHNWAYLSSTNTHGENLTLSVCKFGDEYTCESGECIAISKRCNKITDCLDGSDEISCDVILFPVSYIKAHAPSDTSVSLNEVRIATRYIIENINAIDTMQMKIGLTISIQLTWKDERLTFKNIRRCQSYVVSEEDTKKLWLPLDHAYHVNAILSTITQGKRSHLTIFGNHSKPSGLLDFQEDNIFPGTNNSLSETRTFQIYYNCHFDLQKYPFDAQICVFGLDLKPEEDEKFTIYGQKEQMISYTGSKDVADFAVVGVSSNINSCVGVGSNVIPVDQELVLCIFIRRSHADQIVSIFIPSFLFWVLAYFTMFLNFDDVSNRSRTSVTLLLVLIALLQVVKKDFPKTIYYRYIDIWFLWYILNIFIISLYHIIFPMMRSYLQKHNTVPEIAEDGRTSQAWHDMHQDIHSTKKIEKINLVVVIVIPLMMLGFNFVYFNLTT